MASGYRVKGLPGAKRMDATAGSSLDAMAASGQLPAEDDSPCSTGQRD